MLSRAMNIPLWCILFSMASWGLCLILMSG